MDCVICLNNNTIETNMRYCENEKCAEEHPICSKCLYNIYYGNKNPKCPFCRGRFIHENVFNEPFFQNKLLTLLKNKPSRTNTIPLTHHIHAFGSMGTDFDQLNNRQWYRTNNNASNDILTQHWQSSLHEEMNSLDLTQDEIELIYS